MLFFFKKKRVVFDAFIAIPTAYEFFPIEKASKFLPEWWKEMPPKFTTRLQNGFNIDRNTIKRCDGFTELYKSSFIMPIWSDLKIKTFSNGKFHHMYSGDIGLPPETHPKEQYGDSFSDLIHIKIGSPWLLSTKSGVKCMLHQPFWNQPGSIGHYYQPPGVIDYRYSNGTHVNLFFTKEDADIEFSAGEPIAMITPLSDDDVDIKCHMVSEDEYRKLYSVHGFHYTFDSKFKKTKKILEAKEAKKCPFGFSD